MNYLKEMYVYKMRTTRQIIYISFLLLTVKLTANLLVFQRPKDIIANIGCCCCSLIHCIKYQSITYHNKIE